MEESLITSAVAFGRSIIGLILRPYETYRTIVKSGSLWELLYLAMPMAIYFGVASIVKTAAFRPFLLTKQFIVMASAVGISYIVTVSLFWFVSKFFGRSGEAKGFLVAWGYSLVPTLLWFLATSLLYVVLPPPRTTSAPGMIFSGLFLLFSVAMLLWKITLAYLSLRFGLRLDLGKILATSAIVLPILAIYSYGMYRLGIFRVPFL